MESEAGFVCGVLCGSGHISIGSNGNYSVSLETKSKDMAVIFRENLHKVMSKRPKLCEYDKLYKNKRHTAYLVSVYGKKAVLKFADKYSFRKSPARQWKVPGQAFKNRRFRIGFLRGFFDSKGTIIIRIKSRKSGINKTPRKTFKTRNIRAASTNKRGLEQVRELLELEGIKSMLYRAGRCFVLDIEGKTRLALFGDKINFSIPSKRKKLEMAISYEKIEKRMNARLTNPS